MQFVLLRVAYAYLAGFFLCGCSLCKFSFLTHELEEQTSGICQSSPYEGCSAENPSLVVQPPFQQGLC